MFRFRVLDAAGEEEVTVQLWGRAVCTEARELQEVLGAVLGGCRHLTIDLSRLSDADASFQALICALHRKSELAHKKITLRGTLCGSRVPVRCLPRCTSLGPDDAGCPIWRPVLRRDAEDAQGAGTGSC
jgi:ABC-type transporter Mla MlaB component